MGRFEKATETFLKQATFLGDADSPLVIALEETAKELDAGGVNASLINQYRLTYQALRERGNEDGQETDPLEVLLNG